MYVRMYILATIKSLQVIIINMKIDTIKYDINFKAKNIKENIPNYSGRDSIKGSSCPYFHNGILRGAGITKMKERKKREDTVVAFDTKHDL